VRAWLERKERLAAQLAQDASLAPKLERLRNWQAARLAATYADLREDARHRAAIDFFLHDVYGTRSAALRTAHLRRAWALMEKALPTSAMEILRDALELEVLSLDLDARIAAALGPAPIDAQRYADAYRCAGRPAERERQIELVVDLARRLSQVVRHAWIARVLRLARKPAEAAGYDVLQSFLERGFAAFRQLGDASQFIAAIDSRERRLMQQLFANAPAPFAGLPLDATRVVGVADARR
jgi:hypothetical protein